jgi:hypothetical protein
MYVMMLICLFGSGAFQIWINFHQPVRASWLLHGRRLRSGPRPVRREERSQDQG